MRNLLDDKSKQAMNEEIEIVCWLYPDTSDSLNPLVKMIDPSYFPLKWNSELYTLKGVDEDLLQEIERNKVWLGINRLVLIYDSSSFDETRLSIRFPNVDSYKDLLTLTAEVEERLTAPTSSIDHVEAADEDHVDEEGQ